MSQQALQFRSTLLPLIMVGLTSAAFATTATAAGVGAKAEAGAGAQIEAPANAQPGGNAESHMSPSGSANSNAQWQEGATRGADRAAERVGTETLPPDLEAADKAAKAKRSGTR